MSPVPSSLGGSNHHHLPLSSAQSTSSHPSYPPPPPPPPPLPGPDINTRLIPVQIRPKPSLITKIQPHQLPPPIIQNARTHPALIRPHPSNPTHILPKQKIPHMNSSTKLKHQTLPRRRSGCTLINKSSRQQDKVKQRQKSANIRKSHSESDPSFPLSPPRRRFGLNRSPSWILTPVRQFVACNTDLPLPKKIGSQESAFYDWDAWALRLFDPHLWCQKGLWDRFVTACLYSRPDPNDRSFEAIKPDLVTMIVKKVVCLLLKKDEDTLSSGERNWITSVTSRQKERNEKKPTLMVLLDLVFPLFDLATESRFRPGRVSSAAESHHKSTHIDKDIKRIVLQAVNEVGLNRIENVESMSTCSGREGWASRANSITPQTDTPDLHCQRMTPIVSKVLTLAHGMIKSKKASAGHSIDIIRKAMSRLLTKIHSKPIDDHTQGLRKAAELFVEHVPISEVIRSKTSLEVYLITWLTSSLTADKWKYWAQLAEDFNTLTITLKGDRDVACTQLCQYIVDFALQKSPFYSKKSNTSLTNQYATFINFKIDPNPVQQSNLTTNKLYKLKLGFHRMLCLAATLDLFFATFCRNHGEEHTDEHDIRILIVVYEQVVQELGILREFFVNGSQHTNPMYAMIEWSSRAVSVSNFYRSSIRGMQELKDDAARTIQFAFAEASWNRDRRTRRLNSLSSPHTPKAVGDESSQASQYPPYPLSLTSLDFSDRLNVAAAIAPWDPCKSLKLLDHAIGLKTGKYTGEEKTRNLPLFDFRRIYLYRIVFSDPNRPHKELILDRLHALFERKALHEGGCFSPKGLEILQTEINEGNVYARTTLGLLLANDDTYWKTARIQANCGRIPQEGCKHLFAAANAGDFEACTGLAYTWTQLDSTDAPTLGGASQQNFYDVCRFAVTLQNGIAASNLGIIWAKGVRCFFEANHIIAQECFVVALQGSLSPELRRIAVHYLETYMTDDTGRSLLDSILQLQGSNKGCQTLTESPSRVEDLWSPAAN